MNKGQQKNHDQNRAKAAASPLSNRDLREKRIDDLMDSCRDQVLMQIIGPFGLTPAMFNDKEGGNVTTTHNFKDGVVGTEKDDERYKQYKSNVESPIDRNQYDDKFPEKRKAMFQRDEPIVSAYTGNELTRDGQTHLDHVKPVEKIERDPKANLFMSKEQRVDMANAPENLVPAESNINQSMGAKEKDVWANRPSSRDKSKTNAEAFGVDMDKLNSTKEISDSHVEREKLKAQITKQGSEILSTGCNEALRNALRQAIGLLLHELVSGTYVEIRRVAKEPNLSENFIDHLIESIKNVAKKIQEKFKKIFERLISGGVQGFVSNLLTYIINSFITTSAKVVTIIRESMKNLWDAMKVFNDSKSGLSGAEKARQITKLIAGIVTVTLGMLLEKSVEGFILINPLLAPLVGIIAPALTAIVTGIMTALVIFGIDKFFDWLNSSGTEMLEAQIANFESAAIVFEEIAKLLEAQFINSKNYQICFEQYGSIEEDLRKSARGYICAIQNADSAVEGYDEIISICEKQLPLLIEKQAVSRVALDSYKLGE